MRVSSQISPSNLEEIISKKIKFSYQDIIPSDSRVVLLGEQHGFPLLGFSNDSPKEELIQHLQEFKALGFCYLGMEMIPSEFQGLLDNYFHTSDKMEERILEKEILEVLKIFWKWSPQKYLAVIKASKRCGIKVIALNFNNSEDIHMGREAEEILEDNPQSRLLIFVGYDHLYNLGQYLKEFYPFKIAFIGGGIYTTFGKKEWNVIEKEAQEKGIAGQRFFISKDRVTAILGYNPIMGADIYIHLPSLE